MRQNTITGLIVGAALALSTWLFRWPNILYVVAALAAFAGWASQYISTSEEEKRLLAAWIVWKEVSQTPHARQLGIDPFKLDLSDVPIIQKPTGETIFTVFDCANARKINLFCDGRDLPIDPAKHSRLYSVQFDHLTREDMDKLPLSAKATSVERAYDVLATHLGKPKGEIIQKLTELKGETGEGGTK